VKILSLNPNRAFEHYEPWRQYATAVTELDPKWRKRSLLAKAFALTKIPKTFDVILFYSDTRLAVFASLLQRFLAPSRCLVFERLLRDTSVHSVNVLSGSRNQLGLWLHRILVHFVDAVIVHTRAEVEMYSKAFKVPQSRFIFIPYFYYDDAANWTFNRSDESGKNEDSPHILAIGRHRDFGCFVRALSGTSWPGCIVGGASDREELHDDIPENVEAHFELSREEYRRQIARANIVVLPFYADRWQRSLGQIAMFEAMSMQKPVIAARTFQLADYATENEVLFYRAGDASHLRQQIARLVEDPALGRQLVENAATRIEKEFGIETYIEQLINSCQAAANSKERAMLQRAHPAADL
jgi:glycosyltransferase involved in cell wall biosynthesis